MSVSLEKAPINASVIVSVFDHRAGELAGAHTFFDASSAASYIFGWAYGLAQTLGPDHGVDYLHENGALGRASIREAHVHGWIFDLSTGCEDKVDVLSLEIMSTRDYWAARAYAARFDCSFHVARRCIEHERTGN